MLVRAPFTRHARLVARVAQVLLCLVVALLASGCGAVPAYQRAWLAKKPMQPTPNPQAAATEEHVFEYREGSAGGTGTLGGGCGCN